MHTDETNHSQYSKQLHTSWAQIPLLLLYPFNSLFSGTTWVNQNQKGKVFRILLEQEMTGWQWHQLHHTQIICTSLQTDKNANTSPFSASKHWRLMGTNGWQNLFGSDQLHHQISNSLMHYRQVVSTSLRCSRTKTLFLTKSDLTGFFQLIVRNDCIIWRVLQCFLQPPYSLRISLLSTAT